MGNPLLAVGTSIYILMTCYFIAATAGCAFLEFVVNRQRIGLVPLILLPMFVLSICGAFGMVVDLVNGSFFLALQSSRTAVSSLVFIPAIWLYIFMAVRRRFFIKKRITMA